LDDRQYLPLTEGKISPRGIGTGLLLGASLLDPRGEAVGERIPGGSAPRVDRPATLAVLRCLEIELASDFEILRSTLMARAVLVPVCALPPRLAG
jgi:hypothetical protein